MRRFGKDRKCKSCDKKLSAYNDNPICLDCVVIPSDVAKILRELKGFANGKFNKDE